MCDANTMKNIGKNIYETGEYKQFMVAFTTLQLTTLATMEGKDRFMAPRDAKTSGKSVSVPGKKTVGKCLFCTSCITVFFPALW